MHADFWLERWQRGETGFHRDGVNPWLDKHLAALRLQPGDHVFLPLCGKSRDLRFLADLGFRVSGIELSPLAVGDFFREQSLQPAQHEVDGLTLYEAGHLRIFCGDFFRLARDVLGTVDAVFDRAALIALPPDMRVGYASRMAELLPSGTRMLLVGFDYPQHEMSGPPFAVPQSEVRALFGPAFDIAALGRADLLAEEPRFRERGLTRLQEQAWLLVRR